MANLIFGRCNQLGPAFDEAVSLLSPVQWICTIIEELIQTIREVLDTLFKILRNLLIAFEHGMHCDHVSNGSHRGQLSSGNILCLLFFEIFNLGTLIGLRYLVQVKVGLNLDHLDLDIILGSDLALLLLIWDDLLLLDLLLKLQDGIDLLLLISKLLVELILERAHGVLVDDNFFLLGSASSLHSSNLFFLIFKLYIAVPFKYISMREISIICTNSHDRKLQ
jgi:hypothetical protein